MKDNVAKDNVPENISVKENMYVVVINDEEQYSIWPDFKETPPGWRAAGSSAPPAPARRCG